MMIPCCVCGTQRYYKPSVIQKSSNAKRYCSRACQNTGFKTQFLGENNPAFGRVYRTKETHPEWAKSISDHLERYNPKSSNHWILVIPTIDCFLVNNVRLPQIPVGDRIHFEVDFHFPQNTSLVNSLLSLLRSGTQHDVVLKYLDDLGKTTETWMFGQAHVVTVWFDELKYVDDGRPLMVHARFELFENNFTVIDT